MADKRTVRIGIDVGGTFTHAVAIDHKTLEIVRTVCVPTTHSAREGVALGIRNCLESLVRDAGIDAESVAFVAHSTTQATNALLEGDVAQVGLLGLLQGAAGAKARRELDFSAVPLSQTHNVTVHSEFLAPDASEQDIRAAGDSLRAKGAGALVVAQAFATDDPASEQRAMDILCSTDLPATATHQVSGLYGLKARTRTSIINAGILPRMVEVSASTRDAVERLGIGASLMIMRSDGGVMDAARMARTPILTILSGPAAGVSAAILHEKLSNGLFVEVGGTSTDISLIRNGRPQKKNAVIGGNVLYLETLDVRTVGVAGGSMIRVAGTKLIDVGPRSAHIAGLPYACFLEPERLQGACLEFTAPKTGDPADYAVIKLADGTHAAITTTCAANALGILPEGDYARANQDSANAALDLLAGALGMVRKGAAAAVLDAAADKTAALCRRLIKDYECAGAALIVAGGGGGASVIAPRTAEKLGLSFTLAANAPVVSAVGAGMAMLKEVVERSIVNPTEDDIRAVRSEALRALSDAGCDPATIEVDVSVDARRGVVRADATGSSVLVADKMQEKIDAHRALELAAAQMKVQDPPALMFDDGATFVFQGDVKSGGFLGLGRKRMRPAAVVDARGLVRLSLDNARVYALARQDAETAAGRAIEENTVFGDGGAVLAPMHLVYGGKVVDLSRAGGPDAARSLAAMEIVEAGAWQAFCIVARA
jgi:N-methylhydantoinase A/oxoprolinase/acetone carboxylase beta subunit